MRLRCEGPSGASSVAALPTLSPERLPPPSRDLAVGYRREAEQVGLPGGLDEAHQLLADWLDPVLTAISDAGNVQHASDRGE